MAAEGFLFPCAQPAVRRGAKGAGRMSNLNLAERVIDLDTRGEDTRKRDYIVEQLLSDRTDLGAIVLAAGDILRRYDRTFVIEHAA